MWYVSVRVDVWSEEGYLMRSVELAECTGLEGILPEGLTRLLDEVRWGDTRGLEVVVGEPEWYRVAGGISRAAWKSAEEGE